ncbi:uncharacterized protein LOC108710389 isoform X2 [Xenopus laevis]|uniref:Uncharacterized protein LOC108710389 isoform X2 n=1 Tax=Xenopus laevis TaxID=8355 RepID=A0A8J1MNI4_XENLA|nr:uncharacterized protein LOC108710389 isoform X2 [Xenopus laevis]
MSALLVLWLVLSLWGAVWGRPGQYCADQPAGVEVFAGDSVTFPCSFVFPRTLTGITNRTIVFQAGNISYCGDRIYNSRYGNTTQEYQGRVSLVGDPQAQNGTITLTSVRTSDRKNFCCRVQLLNQNTIIEQWQNGLGTRLTVRGENKMTMHQPPFISALVGDTVTIPCHFSINSKKEIQKKSVSSVQWRFGQSPSCGTVIYNSSTGAVRREDRERISVAGEGGASILIKRVTTNDRGWYCCGAQVTGDGQVYTTQRERGTNLTITGKTDQMKIKQPKEVTFTNSSTISCNFTLPEDEDPLWLGIYWMFGNPREGFAYHPHPELIHPRYRGKTRLVGQSDLYLEEVIGMDNTNFYCRVAMRLCNDTQQNTIETLLEEGAGTLLRVNADPSDQTKIIAASVVSAIILILLLFIILCLVKHKGMRKQVQQSKQKKSESATPEYEGTESVRKEQTTDMSLYTTIEETARASCDPSNNGGQLLYSTVNHSLSSTNHTSSPDSGKEVFYADVKRN